MACAIRNVAKTKVNAIVTAGVARELTEPLKALSQDVQNLTTALPLPPMEAIFGDVVDEVMMPLEKPCHSFTEMERLLSSAEDTRPKIMLEGASRFVSFAYQSFKVAVMATHPDTRAAFLAFDGDALSAIVRMNDFRAQFQSWVDGKSEGSDTLFKSQHGLFRHHYFFDMKRVADIFFKWHTAALTTIKAKCSERAQRLIADVAEACPDKATLNSPLILTVPDLQNIIMNGKPKGNIVRATAMPFVSTDIKLHLKSAIKTGRSAAGLAGASMNS